MDAGVRLRLEFQARQAEAMTVARCREKRQRRRSAAVGAAAGIATVALTALLTRSSLAWHSFLLEAVLCGAAGHLLARLHGGFMRGIVLLPAAYFAAWSIRATGLDPTVLLLAANGKSAIAGQGHLMALGLLVAVGGFMGHGAEE